MENPYTSMLWDGFAQVIPVLPYFIFILAFIFALTVLEAKFGRKKRGRWRRSSDWRRDRGKVVPFGPRHDAVPDAADQLRTVMQADFKPQPLLNKSETRLFHALEQMVAEMAPGWRVMAQVSLGEVLCSQDQAAYSCINSKRVDILIVDGDYRPLHAIEYQGSGHFKGAHATAARDAVKKEALRRAGIGYEEVVAGNHTPAELRRGVEKLCSVPAAPEPNSC